MKNYSRNTIIVKPAKKGKDRSFLCVAVIPTMVCYRSFFRLFYCFCDCVKGAMAPVADSGEKNWAHLSCTLVFGEVRVSDDRTSIDLDNCEQRRKKKWVCIFEHVLSSSSSSFWLVLLNRNAVFVVRSAHYVLNAHSPAVPMSFIRPAPCWSTIRSSASLKRKVFLIFSTPSPRLIQPRPAPPHPTPQSLPLPLSSPRRR